MATPRDIKQDTSLKRVSRKEAQENPEYWEVVSYRFEKIAKQEILGNEKIKRYVQHLLKTSDIDETKATPQQLQLLNLEKTIIEKLRSQWLFSTNDEFSGNNVSPTNIAIQIQNLIAEVNPEYATQFTTNIDELENLHKRMQDIRAIWNAYIKSDRLTLSFIQEPTDDVYEEHAEKIRKGLWTELNFDEPNFQRNLFKALRLKKITASDLLYAEILQGIFLLYGRTPLKLHSYQDAKDTAYDLKKVVPYIKNQEEEQVKQAIQNDVKKNQQCYITVDFPKDREALFFYSLLISIAENPIDWEPTTSGTQFTAIQALAAYCGDFTLDGEKVVIDYDFVLDKTKREKLLQYLLKNNKSMEELVTKIEKNKASAEEEAYYDNAVAAIGALLATNETTPFFGFYDDVNRAPNSPLLYRILPSPDSFNKTNEVLFPKSAVKPAPIPGLITTRKMRQISKSARRRGVSVFHPDVVNLEKAHGMFFHFFESLYHDFYLHGFRAGANPFFEFTDYLSDLISGIIHADMNKILWANTDFDFISQTIHEAYKKKDVAAYHEAVIEFINSVCQYRTNSPSDWGGLFTDMHALLIIDMTVNLEKWTNFFKSDLFPAKINLDEIVPNNERPQQARQVIDFILTARILKPDQPDFYTCSVLAIHLLRYLEPSDHIQTLKWINFVREKMGINNIVHWHQDSLFSGPEPQFREKNPSGQPFSGRKDFKSQRWKMVLNQVVLEFQKRLKNDGEISTTLRDMVQCISFLPEKYLEIFLDGFNKETLRNLIKFFDEKGDPADAKHDGINFHGVREAVKKYLAARTEPVAAEATGPGAEAASPSSGTSPSLFRKKIPEAPDSNPSQNSSNKLDTINPTSSQS